MHVINEFTQVLTTVATLALLQPINLGFVVNCQSVIISSLWHVDCPCYSLYLARELYVVKYLFCVETCGHWLWFVQTNHLSNRTS